MAAEKLLLADIEEIAKTVVREAKAGAHWACRLVIMACLPPARDRLTPFRLPKIAGPDDLPDAVMTVLEAAASGEITLAEAERVTRLIEGLRAAYETRDLASEVETMRAEVDALREHGNGAARTWP
jgi:hypothetical protein